MDPCHVQSTAQHVRYVLSGTSVMSQRVWDVPKGTGFAVFWTYPLRRTCKHKPRVSQFLYWQLHSSRSLRLQALIHNQCIVKMKRFNDLIQFSMLWRCTIIVTVRLFNEIETDHCHVYFEFQHAREGLRGDLRVTPPVPSPTRLSSTYPLGRTYSHPRVSQLLHRQPHSSKARA